MDEGSSQALILGGIFFVIENIIQVLQDTFSWIVTYMVYGTVQKTRPVLLNVFAVERKYLYG